MEGARVIALTPGMRMGMGIASEIEQVRGQVVQIDGERPSGSTGQTINPHLQVVTSQTELCEALSVSASISVSGFGAGLDAKMSMAQSHSVNDYAVHILLTDTVKNAARSGINPHLHPDALAAWTVANASGDSDAFRAQFGDSWIDEIGGGGEFYGLLIFQTHDESSHQSVSGSLSLHIGSALTGGGSFSLDFRNDVDSAAKQSDMSLWVCASGGSGLENPRTMEELLQMWAHFNASVQANPIDNWVTIKDIRLLPLPPGPSIEEQLVRNSTISTIRQRVMDGLQHRQQIDYILAHPAEFISPDLDALRAASQELDDKLPKLGERATACSKDIGRCGLSDLTEVPIAFPNRVVKLDPLGFKLDAVLAHGEPSAKAFFTNAAGQFGGTKDYSEDPVRHGRFVLFTNADFDASHAPISGLFWHPEVDSGNAHICYGDIFKAYLKNGHCEGSWGYPVTDELPVEPGDPHVTPPVQPPFIAGIDRKQRFEHSTVFWRAGTRAVEVHAVYQIHSLPIPNILGHL